MSLKRDRSESVSEAPINTPTTKITPSLMKKLCSQATLRERGSKEAIDEDDNRDTAKTQGAMKRRLFYSTLYLTITIKLLHQGEVDCDTRRNIVIFH